MKSLIAAVLLLASPASAQYFNTIAQNPAHPYMSAGTNLTMKGAFDGVTTQVALIWHKGDPKDSMLPQALLDAGVQPISWSLLDCGAGYGNGAGVLTCGSAVNLAPTLLGPLAKALGHSSSAMAQGLATMINGSPAGTGLALGYTWHAEPIQSGTLLPFDRWGSHLDAFLGLAYGF